MSSPTTPPARVGPESPPRDISVFLNCPFDERYGPLFDALIFTTLCCGFVPRSAIESGSAATPRMDRLRAALLTSRYSIHDLSRAQGEGELNLARFNMPLELGIALGHSLRDPEQHQWFALTLEDHESSRYISDLMGFDLKRHNGTVETLVPPVLSWLLTLPEAVGDPNPRQVLEAYGKFRPAVTEERLLWSGELSWRKTLGIARRFVPTP